MSIQTSIQTSIETHLPARTQAVVIGGGQAGLAMSYHLKARGIDHVVLEKEKIAHSWRTQRWESFCLVTPNWQCLLPGFPYQGNDPNGFMLKDEIVAYVAAYAKSFGAPVRENVAVTRVERRDDGCFTIETSAGVIIADTVVLAVGGYHQPNIPASAARLPPDVDQFHSSTYRSAWQLPAGSVMVVGSGQSGCQIAEDLHLAGRQVHLVTGSAPRCPRVYRGRDAVDWLSDLGQYDLPVDQHPLKEKVRKKANHYLTGRDGGRDIDLRKFAIEGMRLYGRLEDIGAGGRMIFADNLLQNLDSADATYNNICAIIDKHIEENKITAPASRHYVPVWRPENPARELDLKEAGVTSIVWATGFRANWSWVNVPIFDANGYPDHRRGVTPVTGIYVLGLPWLYTWGSGRFVGVGRDAGFLADRIEETLAAASRSDPVRMAV
jgi:putative flavoprotein involved in K+ transport